MPDQDRYHERATSRYQSLNSKGEIDRLADKARKRTNETRESDRKAALNVVKDRLPMNNEDDQGYIDYVHDYIAQSVRRRM